MKCSQPIIAVVLALGLTSAQASIPTPAAPPENLPYRIAGIPGEQIWFSFSERVRFTAVDRIDVAAIASVPLPRQSNETVYLERLGPTVRMTAGFQEMSNTIRFERVCERQPEAFYNRSADECYWQARVFRLSGLHSIDDLSRASFDPEAIEAYLLDQDIRSETFGRADTGMFGLAEVVIAGLDRLVRENVVDERSCPAVARAIQATTELNPLNLSAVTAEDRELIDHSGPPPPPMGMNFTFTIPVHGYAGLEGELVLRAGASPQALGIAGALRQSIHDCLPN